MSYAAAIDQLNAMAPELYTRPGQPRRKFSLDEVRTLLAALGDPHRRIRAMLVAGTNGKGSTASTLASILTASGVRAGLYTSPHLERVNERIRMDRAEIADDAFGRLYFRVHDVAQKLVLEGSLPQLPSFFEILTAQAMLYFAEEKVELAVLEVGMGGRLDATNVVDPLLSIITDISLDHTEWLGSTITAITREKAGILRRGGTMITLSQHPEANQALGEAATELGVRAVNASAFMPLTGAGPVASYSVEALGATVEVASPLTGAHQQRNIALAIAAASELASVHGFPVTPAAIAEGIRQTRWPGRLEHIKQGRVEAGGVEWILDVAHNPAGAWALYLGLTNLLSEERHRRLLIFSCLRDKPVAEMAQILFPLFDQVIFAPIHSARAAAIEDMEAAARATGTSTLSAGSVRQALQWARERGQSGVVVVSGSVYLVGEARSLLFAGGFE
ncbi:MAG: folylpolyglutamate synthase/dihydrofolate synthase family protein [Terracidiphilus sp.]|jgi:dihydrofolate synthase/folylpolyglutamate synthase